MVDSLLAQFLAVPRNVLKKATLSATQPVIFLFIINYFYNNFKTGFSSAMATVDITGSNSNDLNKPFRFEGYPFKCWQQKMMFCIELNLLLMILVLWR